MPSSYDTHFRAQILDSRSWINAAEEILWTAKQLEPSITCEKEIAPGKTQIRFKLGRGLAQYFMLIAFAVENYLKAVLVQKLKPELARDLETRDRLPRILKGHDLARLARKAGFTPTADTEVLLKRLSRSAIWSGRYPVPLQATSFGPERTEDGQEVNASAFGGLDFMRINTLLRRLKKFVGDSCT